MVAMPPWLEDAIQAQRVSNICSGVNEGCSRARVRVGRRRGALKAFCQLWVPVLGITWGSAICAGLWLLLL